MADNQPKSDDFRFPTGRLVSGNLYKANTEDYEGKPYDEPRYSYGVAVPKGAEAGHGEKGWAFLDGVAFPESWGNKIWAIAHQGHPQAGQLRDFAFKVTDGDSAVLNTAGKAPKDKTGYPGHWILWFGGTIAPNLYSLNAQGQPVADPHPNATQPGDYVQVFGNVKYNGSTKSPGVYLNANMVCRIGYGERIAQQADPTKAGFGGPLPPGASAVPLGNANIAPPPGASPPISAPPAAALPPIPGATAAPPMPAASTPVPVTPNPGILNPVPGAAPPLPTPPAAPPVPTARTMTAKAEGRAYETFIQGGWTDAMMIENGYMTP